MAQIATVCIILQIRTMNRKLERKQFLFIFHLWPALLKLQVCLDFVQCSVIRITKGSSTHLPIRWDICIFLYSALSVAVDSKLNTVLDSAKLTHLGTWLIWCSNMDLFSWRYSNRIVEFVIWSCKKLVVSNKTPECHSHVWFSSAKSYPYLNILWYGFE